MFVEVARSQIREPILLLCCFVPATGLQNETTSELSAPTAPPTAQPGRYHSMSFLSTKKRKGHIIRSTTTEVATNLAESGILNIGGHRTIIWSHIYQEDKPYHKLQIIFNHILSDIGIRVTVDTSQQSTHK